MMPDEVGRAAYVVGENAERNLPTAPLSGRGAVLLIVLYYLANKRTLRQRGFSSLRLDLTDAVHHARVTQALHRSRWPEKVWK